MQLDLDQVPGLSIRENGQTVLSGELAAARPDARRPVRRLAAGFGAEEYRFPPQIPARLLERIDYFRSFPHLATFPVALDKDADNLREFAERLLRRRGAPDATGLHPERADARRLLPRLRRARGPGTRIHALRDHARNVLSATRTPTPRLQRQWAFSMREVVCIGTAADVERFLDQARTRSPSA